MTQVRRTRSVCPVCLRQVPASLHEEGGTVFMRKRCPDHGEFSCPVWEGPPGLEGWTSRRFPLSGPEEIPPPFCPDGCGSCREHLQKTCTVLVEVTERCSLGCPVCFADSGGSREPAFDSLTGLMKEARKRAPEAILQLSGGEPAERDDLPALVRAASGMGFAGIQLNTNGLRLALEPGYAKALKEAGLGWVFLQFDGLKDSTSLALRGRPLGAAKEKAVEACGEAGLGVVLVPTLVEGINDDELGDIVRFGLSRFPVVRGVHFQPISYFGRYPGPAGDQPRLTLPRIMRLLEAQTGGAARISHFHPSRCEHERCSFRAVYLVEDGGTLVSVGQESCCACRGPEDGPKQSVESLVRRWGADLAPDAADPPPKKEDDFDRFLRLGKRGSFSISAMAFQDAENLDLERLRHCCIHVAAPDGGLVPFCAWNLTARDGTPLYRRR